MKISTILTDVRNELVEASASFWSDTELLALANRAERDFVQKTRCLEGSASIVTVAGQQDYPLPANWLSALLLLINVPQSDGTPSWTRINPTSLEKEGQENSNFLSSSTSSRSTPCKYWVFHKSLYLDPIPDTSGQTIQMFFKAKPVPFIDSTGDINIDDSLSEAINNFMLWKAWKKEKESAEAAEAQALYMDNVKQGHRWVKKQSNDLRNRLDIESPRGYGSGSSGFNPFRP